MDDTYCIVTTTTATQEEADIIASALLSAKLAACVQIVDIQSHYSWKDEILNEPEKLLLIKAKTDLYPEIQKHISAIHTYTVPEIVKLPIEDGLPAYLAWIDDVSR